METPRRGAPRHCRLIALAAAWLVAAAVLSTAAPAAAWTPGVPLSQPFPRLAMWWPDPDVQPVSQIARYDWVVLGPWDDPAVVSRIRALHPDEILLNATNACEIDYDPDATATDSANADLRAVPAQWLLTQVGAGLTAPIDASVTKLRVSAVTTRAPDGATVPLFEPGDGLVIESEFARVLSVDATARTLTVRRGVVKAATAHAGGTRVAATISFWPGSLMLDLTDACPEVTVDASAGPENWVRYNARIGASLARTAAWDGLMIDRADGDESWLIGASTARTIDPDRSNRVPAEYTAFDRSWDAGLLAYEIVLRSALGDGKLMMTNWGYPHFSALNGDNLEGFPSSDRTQYPWATAVFGPWAGKGSYLEWLTSSRQPNLTTIETYQDDGGPDPTGDGSYDNPATHPGFVPDYRKMRFGLATALLGDGFFSYEINTNGHGSLGLLWFDEYEGAGRGPGWLGAATAPAYRVKATPTGTDLLSHDGGFETPAALGAWDFSVEPTAAASATLVGTGAHAGASALRVDVTASDGIDWHVATSHPVAVAKGGSYTLSFWARADSTRTVDAWVQQASDPWDDLADLGGASLTPVWKHFDLSAPSSASDQKAQLVLALGGSAGSVWLDGVTFTRGDPNVWRRDFENGAALVNATDATATVALGRTYRRLHGRQAPAVNDGRLVSTLVLGPRDGIVVAAADASGFGAALADAARGASSSANHARAAATAFASRVLRAPPARRAGLDSARRAWLSAAAAADALCTASRAAAVHADALDPVLAPSVATAVARGASLRAACGSAWRIGATAQGRFALRSAYAAASRIDALAAAVR